MIAGALLLTAAALSTATAAPQVGAVGIWKTPEDGGSFVRIDSCGDALCGWIVTSPRLRAFPDQRDVRNPDAALRSRQLRNLLILKVRPTGPDRWGDGWVYSPKEGATYKGSIELKSVGSLRLTGCVVAPFCKAQTWERASESAAGSP